MAFKKKDNQEDVKQFLSSTTSRHHHTRDRGRGFSARHEVRRRAHARRRATRPYLDALPQAKLVPRPIPSGTGVKLDVQQHIGLAVQPGGNPRQVLDALQQRATAATEERR